MTSGITHNAPSGDLPSQSLSKEMEAQNGSNTHRKTKRRRLKRLVSQDELGISSSCKEKVSDILKRAESLRCVSEFDKAMPDAASMNCPPLRNPLDDPSIRNAHTAALRLEADLHPMRLILSRLMADPKHNRKGLFNHPVDPVALGLLDYHLIVTRPMDLGTVKRRLHAVAYQSREQAAEDIRVVFTNAMRYNPPHNVVHLCAKELLANFEEAYQGLGTCVSSPPSPTTNCSSAEAVPHPPQATTRTVSFMEEDKLPAGASDTISSDASVITTPSATSTSDCSPDPLAPGASKPQVPDGPQPEGESHACANKSSTLKDTVPSSFAAPPVHTQANWRQLPLSTPSATLPKRKSRLPPFLPHTCQSCKGRTCTMCKQGCLFHEPSLLVCQGCNCGGAKIRKGANYFITKDGNRQFCQKCYVNIPPVLPNSSDSDVFRYKQDLLKRKNDEEIAEDWLNCSNCSVGVHTVCAMRNDYVHGYSDFLCSDCHIPNDGPVNSAPDSQATEDTFTFLSGSDCPVPISSTSSGNAGLRADSLPECAISAFIEVKVRECMKVVPNADKTVTVRVISDCTRQFNVPEVVRRHFRMATESDAVVKPPSKVKYQQKAIALFQKIDGLDVCIYCMYVQEYDGDDQYEDNEIDQVKSRRSKRVYIAYIDSIEHFRPRECRTEVYHEILVSYLATARQRGYETAQIWACPPSRGNNFVFWNHPASQRTPTKERLVAWYHGALSRAIGCGVVTDVKSLFETEFQQSLSDLEKEANVSPQQGTVNIPCGRMLCPPLLDGDFWIEEAVRVHHTSISRNLKIRSPTEVCVWNVSTLSSDDLDPCPALQVATLIKDRIMSHPSSVPFRRPVNAAALKLKNYHQIITKPIDLGTIYSRCVLGEYQVLHEMVDDVKLMVANAKKFNPVGHFVHLQADEIFLLFFQELSALTKFWETDPSEGDKPWESYSDMGMSLDMILDMPTTNTVVNSTSVVIEDDRSSDGSRSMSSFVSVPTSPMSRASSTKEEESVLSLSAPKRTLLTALSSLKSPARTASKTTKKAPLRNLNLLSDGPEAVEQCMVGDDIWLLDKRNPTPPKGSSPTKKTNSKRGRSLSSADTSTVEPVSKRRRQSWLGEEVADSVRGMRTSFFTCSLSAKTSMSDDEREKLEDFQSYVDSFDTGSDAQFSFSSPITDARSALLEFSQFRHLEFDTLRRAKYSTAILLYHLKHENASGVIPLCSTCEEDIHEVRWHKVKKVAEKRRATKNLAFSKATKHPEPEFILEELCACCHAQHSQQDDFIPIPVSLKL